VPDDGKAVRLLDGGEQLEILAEPDIVDRGAFRQRHRVEVDYTAHPGTARDVPRVDRDPIGDVHQRVRGRGKRAPLVEPDWWSRITLARGTLHPQRRAGL